MRNDVRYDAGNNDRARARERVRNTLDEPFETEPTRREAPMNSRRSRSVLTAITGSVAMAVMQKAASKAMKKQAEKAAKKGVKMAKSMAKSVSDRVTGRAAKKRKRIKVAAAAVTGVALAGIATGVAMMRSKSGPGRKRR